MRVPLYDNQLLNLAEDLARRLLPAFDTPTGIARFTTECAYILVSLLSRSSFFVQKRIILFASFLNILLFIILIFTFDGIAHHYGVDGHRYRWRTKNKVLHIECSNMRVEIWFFWIYFESWKQPWAEHQKGAKSIINSNSKFKDKETSLISMRSAQTKCIRELHKLHKTSTSLFIL